MSYSYDLPFLALWQILDDLDCFNVALEVARTLEGFYDVGTMIYNGRNYYKQRGGSWGHSDSDISGVSAYILVDMICTIPHANLL